MNNDGISLTDRIVAGSLSALLMAIMALGVPIFLAVLSRGRGLEILGAFGTFHTRGGAVILVAGLVGAALGSERVIVLFAHLWGTEQPRQPAFTFALWVVLISIGGVSYWLFGMHRRL